MSFHGAYYTIFLAMLGARLFCFTAIVGKRATRFVQMSIRIARLFEAMRNLTSARDATNRRMEPLKKSGNASWAGHLHFQFDLCYNAHSLGHVVFTSGDEDEWDNRTKEYC